MSIYFRNLDLSKIIKKRKPRVRIPLNAFPVKLYKLLQEETEKGINEHIVGWNQDGLSFQVRDIDQFVNEVLPIYFNQTKYKSFQRQLNFYGFRRLGPGPLEGSYCHDCFIRGKKELCLKIRRQSSQESTEAPRIAIPDQIQPISKVPTSLSTTRQHNFAQELLPVLAKKNSDLSSSQPVETKHTNSVSTDPEVEDDFFPVGKPSQLGRQETILIEGNQASFVGGKKFYYCATLGDVSDLDDDSDDEFFASVTV